jgi:hypothetical protein
VRRSRNTPAEGEPLGEVIAGTTVLVRAIDGDFASIEIPPCELVPAEPTESFWIRADALD